MPSTEFFEALNNAITRVTKEREATEDERAEEYREDGTGPDVDPSELNAVEAFDIYMHNFMHDVLAGDIKLETCGEQAQLFQLLKDVEAYKASH